MLADIAHRQSMPSAGAALQASIVGNRFDVGTLPVNQQLLAWRERMGMVIDVVLSRDLIQLPFRAAVERYDIGEYLFSESYTDQITLDRSIARISRDNARTIVFHVFLGGASESVVEHTARRQGKPLDVGILAVDLDQTVRVWRRDSRHVNIFVPVSRLQNVFADPGVLHGRVLSPFKASVRLIVERVAAFARNIRHMPAAQAHRHLSALVELIAAAFGEEIGLSGSRRAIAREIAFSSARCFVQANLADSDLTPARVLESLGLSRPTMYRLFQHEGGLGAYIRHLRLRTAANDIARFPGIAVKDVAYSVGFKSASDFTRAFRRAFGVSPQDLREYEGQPSRSACPDCSPEFRWRDWPTICQSPPRIE